MMSFRCCIFLQVFGYLVEASQCLGSIQIGLSNEEHPSMPTIRGDQVLLEKVSLQHELPWLPGHLRFLKSKALVDMVPDVPLPSRCANKAPERSPDSFLPPPPSQPPSSARGTFNGAFNGVSHKSSLFR